MTTVEPKLIVNKPMEDMYPFLDEQELEKLMIIKPLKDWDVHGSLKLNHHYHILIKYFYQ